MAAMEKNAMRTAVKANNDSLLVRHGPGIIMAICKFGSKIVNFFCALTQRALRRFQHSTCARPHVISYDGVRSALSVDANHVISAKGPLIGCWKDSVLPLPE